MKVLLRSLLPLFIVPALLLGATNSIKITERAGKTTTNYPVQIGRPFVQGEIPHFPQAVLGGTEVTTQADVKQRYEDGSVKHAIISFLIPKLNAGSSVVVTFKDQLSGNNTPVSRDGMLASGFNFEATMQMAAPNCPGCATSITSARAMLSAGDFTYWTSGPVATTVILADHTSKKYDLGWQQDKVKTLAKAVTSGNQTYLEVADAAGWEAPMMIRLNSAGGQSDGASSEDMMICSIDTSVTPHRLNLGGSSCPNVDGRRYKASSYTTTWPAGYPLYPNYWRETTEEKYKSVRPIFHATFWPALNKVRVRFIGEVADSEKLQDQVYSLALSLGYSGPQTVYSKPEVIHRGMTRWTKEFWIGGAPTNIDIDHNLPYLISTKFVYNFDTTVRLSFTDIEKKYNDWMAAGRDLYESAKMIKTMGSGGDSDHTGIYTGWNVWWLYTMDWRAKQMASEAADLGAAWLFHVREGDPAKKITRTAEQGCTFRCDEPGLGHVMSITTRPSIQSLNFRRKDRLPGHNPTFVGAVSVGGWTLGMNHAWEPYSVLYSLTGDFWYLEEGWFWAGFGSGYSLGPTNTHREYMRGPTGAEGAFPSEECRSKGGTYVSNPNWHEIRTEAWINRVKINLAFVSPDDTPEKSYYSTLVFDSIAGLEGWHGVPPSVSAPWYQAIWNWGTTVQRTACGVSPLHLFSRGGPDFVQTASPYYGIDSAVTAEANGFGINYVMFMLGRAAETGFPAQAIGKWTGKYFIDLVNDPASNPYLLQMGRAPSVKKSDGTWISSWADFVNSYTSAYKGATKFTQDGYAYVYSGSLALGMAHQLTDDSASSAAWNFVAANVWGKFNMSRLDAIKWAVLPRNAPSPVPTRSRCDINSDGRVDSTDVSMVAAAVTGKTSCGAADVVPDGSCDVSDVQSVVVAVGGGACKTTP